MNRLTLIQLSFSEPLGTVRNLQVIDPTINTLNVRWEPAEGSVREYIVIYVPEAGGEQEVVRHDIYIYIITNQNHIFFRVDLFSDATQKKSVMIDFMTIHEYKQWLLIAFYMSTVCEQEQVSGSTTSTTLKNLKPDTMYTVTLVPVYHEMEGKPLSENGKTSKSWIC